MEIVIDRRLLSPPGAKYCIKGCLNHEFPQLAIASTSAPRRRRTLRRGWRRPASRAVQTDAGPGTLIQRSVKQCSAVSRSCRRGRARGAACGLAGLNMAAASVVWGTAALAQSDENPTATAVEDSVVNRPRPEYDPIGFSPGML